MAHHENQMVAGFHQGRPSKMGLLTLLYNQSMLKSSIIITCPKGLPPYLKEELAALGFPVMRESLAGIETGGSLEDAMLLNLWLRTGHRVLFFLKSFTSRDAAELYAGVSLIEWERYIDADEYLSVHCSVDNRMIRDSRFANQKCKDAIVDRMRRVYGRRPDSGPAMTGAVVFLYWKDELCSVYLDTSGEPLSKRNYRKTSLKAPMQETLAAAVVMASRWNAEGSFINPMCGSGTLAIEAALIGLNRAPGLLRENFGFMHLTGFPPRRWEVLSAQALASGKKRPGAQIIATDINPEAIAAAQRNAAIAGVERFIDFSVCDFRKTPVPDGGGVVMLNPEYGERLGSVGQLELTYRAIGDFFKQHCRGYRGFIFTGNPGLAKNIGLRTKSRTLFFNSNIECRLLEYELYEGSRKKKQVI
jgi:23S rRNA G2445 N2-methylase RlmL